jgi:hypothetical protein
MVRVLRFRRTGGPEVLRIDEMGVSSPGPANCVEGMPCFVLACIWNSRRCRPSSARQAAGTVIDWFPAVSQSGVNP